VLTRENEKLGRELFEEEGKRANMED